MLAIFGLLIFSQGFLGFLSQRAATGPSTAQSFLAAGVVMALLALPLVVGSTREGLAQLPQPHARGLLRARQDTRDDDPPRAAARDPTGASRAGIVLGMGRIIGDTAIISDPARGDADDATGRPACRSSALLRGTGSTLTSYVYENSPAGEGNAPQKAYAAAFVLLLIVLASTRSSRASRGGARRRSRRTIGGCRWTCGTPWTR